jgi:hypothetical protein
MKLEFSWQILVKNTQLLYSVNIRAVAAEFRGGGHTVLMKLIVTLRNFAKAQKSQDSTLLTRMNYGTRSIYIKDHTGARKLDGRGM